MSPLQRHDALSQDLPAFDDGMKTLVALLDLTHDAPDAALVSRWGDLVQHTARLFEREDRWMRNIGFSSAHAHSTQHKVVLQVMREGLSARESHELEWVRKMAHELGLWFAQHAQSMDAALALHLRRVGYDPVTGVLSMPDDIPLPASVEQSVHA
jgi:hemerythrin